MREGDEYQGFRVKLVAGLGRARIPFALDLSFGDPDASTAIDLHSVIDRPPIRLAAYPLALNLAEKFVTLMQRRETNTRDRDLADLWVASRHHTLDAKELRVSINTVAHHRRQPLIALNDALLHMPNRQTQYTAMVGRMFYTTPPPEDWNELIGGVIDFIDPLLRDDVQKLSHWDNTTLTWS